MMRWILLEGNIDESALDSFVFVFDMRYLFQHLNTLIIIIQQCQ